METPSEMSSLEDLETLDRIDKMLGGCCIDQRWYEGSGSFFEKLHEYIHSMPPIRPIDLPGTYVKFLSYGIQYGKINFNVGPALFRMLCPDYAGDEHTPVPFTRQMCTTYRQLDELIFYGMQMEGEDYSVFPMKWKGEKVIRFYMGFSDTKPETLTLCLAEELEGLQLREVDMKRGLAHLGTREREKAAKGRVMEMARELAAKDRELALLRQEVELATKERELASKERELALLRKEVEGLRERLNKDKE
jgi:hypothetical protein